ncbi:class I SAM-dependent methyltransferase [Kitasatospora mediocidica]|uniref:class I SAM-dependent methyltransferase n=1 Tax=Kitasatospora mediocidica TaxID=58352 RepID=UPI00055BE196|nr:methyltransferase domain-containing protein [Kitasatospora mediocidica]
MAAGSTFPGWNWEDPDSLAVLMDDFTGNLARCERIEPIADELPHNREDFLRHGLTGLEFAAFRTRHPQGLGTDLVGLRSAQEQTVPGRLYRIDGESRFTQLDIGDPLPFADASVDWVYAEHLIEHIPLPVSIGWLAEVRRVLRPGGLLRVTTPDLRSYVEGYLEESGGFFARHRRRLRLMKVGPAMPERRAFMMNQIFYHYGHRWIFDEDELRHAFTAAGFQDELIRRRAFQDGARPDVALLDTGFRSDETLYLEVTVPRG